jgi:hypothetical protein
MSADGTLKNETSPADEPTATTDAASTPTDGDTEGHMMLPDRTSQLLARDREREIRQHLSRRELERQSRDSRARK